MPSHSGPAIGIDLGTTFSVIAHLSPTGQPCTIPNSEGDPTTPSVVLFDQNSIVVGKEAVKAAALEPDRVADFAKRDMGSSFYSRKVGGERLPPEVIQSLILEKLKRDAEQKLGPIAQAVITVPAFFDEPRRKATQDAGHLAGLEVLDIINEPTAAAIAYGWQAGFLNRRGEAEQTERILVYDLGGGTFDVTLMEIAGKNYRAIATGGDVFLGGIDWDRRIADYVAERFQEKYRGVDPRQDPGDYRRLLREAEDAKRALSSREETTITFERVGQGLRIPYSRQEFESGTADLMQRTLFTVRSVLKDAGISWREITRLLLVGGSTRMRMVAELLEQEAGMKPDHSISVDESVAHGAAIYAGLILSTRQGNTPTMRVQNVSSHDLGVLAREAATGRRRNSVVIPRNTTLPVTKAKHYRTAQPDQRSVAIQVIEGGDSTGNNSTPIGCCTIRDLPRDLPKGTQVEVRFTYAENGRLTVEARIPDSQLETSVTIDRAGGLSEDNLQEWNDRLRRPGGPLQLDN